MEPPEQTLAPQDRAAAAPPSSDIARLAALGGELLTGSGFEEEEPEPGFSETEISGLAHDQETARN